MKSGDVVVVDDELLGGGLLADDAARQNVSGRVNSLQPKRKRETKNMKMYAAGSHLIRFIMMILPKILSEIASVESYPGNFPVMCNQAISSVAIV